MKKTLPIAFALSAALLSGCTMNGPSNMKVHEAVLYGGTQERMVWVYGNLTGGSSSVKLGDVAVDLRPQVQDSVAVPGSLSVNGKATYRLPTAVISPKVSVSRRSNGQFSVTPTNPGEVSAIYYTDGTNWMKLSGPTGTVSSSMVTGLQGAGNLTNDEAAALSTALLGQGALAVAVLDEASVPDRALNVEPKPEEYKRTALYIVPNVVTVADVVKPVTPPPVTLNPAPTNPTPVNPAPVTPRPGTPINPTPVTPITGAAVNFTDLASGAQARATGLSAQVATTQTEASALYAQAYGRQTSVPTAASVGNSTIVAVFLGQRPTGGYSVKVVNAVVNGGVLTLVVQVKTPGPGSMVTQALTSPWTMVRVDGKFTQVKVVDERGQPLAPGTSGEVR